jgi:glycosyltransferase involved in cell wall biosynthesis
MNEIKKISFIVIAYNEEGNIANCIRSISNQEELKNSCF